MEPIFLTPYFRPKIWGGRKLNTIFHYNIPQGKVGEAWIISGYKDDASTVSAGPLKGKTLRAVYHEHPEMFGNPKEKEFPLLVKFLDANDNLSVQVHPDDAYARKVEHDSGKTESWYVMQADPGSYLIYGHTAKTRKELADMIHKGEWDKLLRKVPVKAGDFFYVPAGTIHALTKGILVIETQQSSDVTYRLYDYDRVDKKTGKKRELHTQKSIDVTTVPHVDPKLNIKNNTDQDAKIKTLVEPPISPHFYLWQIDLDGTWKTGLKKHPYLLVSVISGSGKFEADGQDYELKIGSNFIIPNELKDFTFTGKMKIVMSAPGDKD
ncbi:mannose-6-phosphate isomerase, class I [Lactobacillus acetotolerans]|jgi:mannose-6-phosphate isomerase|uniref:Mannose-6-phosphate isomerase n=1 Tax=Lactobacillus acetotolerans TaxID=1600 RepID=A0A353U9I1_9LACO|nr:mannose-6-phosphate isomerase, class I [Lactobacillus acetotolerans]KRN36912.1 mannose-6-phosphate isomerase [Lactobacillus acetotolerans DSM 20749 = JCM 3825]MBN7276447.1 mannose-6-phosphate isomerase, class I [Lactobacillus acetotolerans]QFG51476.1 mannose-6-phosphate isomerase, class I [Lactobacillus acetotolerans]QGV04412.1 mannose-6-phosphate isomerase, class I [Lactobacillus acetotolerans]QJD73330.1 mannose-6-phosphate isomerase, class I [Lactobacillus acetotolerans]